MKPKLQSGYFMLAAVAIIVIVGFLGIAASSLFSQSTRSSVNSLMATQAFYIAESGLQDATHEINTGETTCSALSTALTNSIGAGSYSVTGAVTSVTGVTGSSAITAAATTIPLASVTGLSSPGVILVNSELIAYTTISGSNLTGATRGYGGTTAAVIAGNSAFSQQECTLTSVGGVPNRNAQSITTLGDPQGIRTLTSVLWMGGNAGSTFAWIGGNSSGGNYQLYQFTSPTTWTLHTLTGAPNILGMSLASNKVGWAVGTGNNVLLYWNGTTWATETTGLPATQLNGVYCPSTVSCIAVGNLQLVAYLANWNASLGSWNGGSLTGAWTRNNNIGSAPSVNMFGVHCAVNTATCFAVGNSATFIQSTNGGITWTTDATTLPAVQYNSVFCNTATDCWAVGNVTGGTGAIVHYTGATAWTTVTPGTKVNANLTAVYCTSTTNCWAGGAVSGGNATFYHGTGSPLTWARITPAPVINASVSGISCTSSSVCWASASAGRILLMNAAGTNWSVSTTAAPVVTLNAISFANITTQTLWSESFPASH